MDERTGIIKRWVHRRREVCIMQTLIAEAALSAGIRSTCYVESPEKRKARQERLRQSIPAITLPDPASDLYPILVFNMFKGSLFTNTYQHAYNFTLEPDKALLYFSGFEFDFMNPEIINDLSHFFNRLLIAEENSLFRQILTEHLTSNNR